MTFKPVDETAVSHDELKRAYRSLLDSRNALKRNNESNEKYAKKLAEVINLGIPHAILIIQALAERAGVRRSKAVVEAMEYLNSIAFPQWGDPDFVPPPLPSVIPLAEDGDEGDAEMLVDAEIAKAMEPFDDMWFMAGIKGAHRDAVSALCRAVQDHLAKVISQVKENAGFKPKRIDWKFTAHPNDMSREELRAALDAITWAALDLAQDMEAARTLLRKDLRDGSYRRIAGDLYAIGNIPYRQGEHWIDVKVFDMEDEPF